MILYAGFFWAGHTTEIRENDLVFTPCGWVLTYTPKVSVMYSITGFWCINNQKYGSCCGHAIGGNIRYTSKHYYPREIHEWFCKKISGTIDTQSLV